MAGIKGMSWGDKKEPKIKLNTSIDKELYKKINGLSNSKKWSFASTLRHVLEAAFNEDEESDFFDKYF